jgi:EAL domain-containing protein (putative c-di-GMP-specific phosphodiesterase class I)
VIDKLSVHPELFPLNNSLEAYYPVIQKFIKILEINSQRVVTDEERIIDAIRICIGAELALVLEKYPNKWELQSQLQTTKTKLDKFLEMAIPTLLAGIQAQGDSFQTDQIGSFSHINISENSVEAIAIPIHTKKALKVAVFCGNKENMDAHKNDIFAQIVLGTFYALEKSSSIDPVQIEAHILDYLKVYYKYLPISFYEQRSKLFNERPAKMSVRFQPIIYLGMNSPFICGFESLASDPKTNRTPLDLMKAAEIWGTRFKIDLDCHFFETALTLYKERLQETAGYRRPQDVLDISINVYPETLLRSAYYSKVEDVMAKRIIPTYRLFLEISEKSPSPEVIPGDGVATREMTSFRDVLKKYVKDFRIAFAIDDFGVGHASVARLGELTPSYIKIDRELLKLETAYETIKFTVDFIEEIVSSKHLSSSKVVLEGYDEEIIQTLSLYRLIKSGIYFIQSYLIGMPTDQLARLNKEQTAYITSLMNK